MSKGNEGISWCIPEKIVLCLFRDPHWTETMTACLPERRRRESRWLEWLQWRHKTGRSNAMSSPWLHTKILETQTLPYGWQRNQRQRIMTWHKSQNGDRCQARLEFSGPRVSFVTPDDTFCGCDVTKLTTRHPSGAQICPKGKPTYPRKNFIVTSYTGAELPSAACLK